MKLGTSISALLFKHDCVIVADFGGFVCQEFSAHINEATQMFVPPSKKVNFQPALSATNLVLERYLSRKLEVSIDQAEELIAEEVAEWKTLLKEGQHIKIEGVGRVYLDNAKKIAFQPEISANFNSEAFGLGIFRFPVLREEASITPQGVVAESKPHTFKLGGVWQKAAMVAAVVGLFYIGTQKADFSALNIASINPFQSSSSTEMTDEANVEEVVSDIPEAFTSALGVIDTEVKALPESQSVEVQKPFHIIVGAFKVEENASDYLQNLRNQGMENAQLFHEKGFYRVSADQFATRSSAKASLKRIKQKIQKGAWIYRK